MAATFSVKKEAKVSAVRLVAGGGGGGINTDYSNSNSTRDKINTINPVFVRISK